MDSACPFPTQKPGRFLSLASFTQVQKPLVRGTGFSWLLSPCPWVCLGLVSWASWPCSVPCQRQHQASAPTHSVARTVTGSFEKHAGLHWGVGGEGVLFFFYFLVLGRLQPVSCTQATHSVWAAGTEAGGVLSNSQVSVTLSCGLGLHFL